MSVSRRVVDDALGAYEHTQNTLQGRGAEIAYRLAAIVRGLIGPCEGCGGDGVQINDDPESTRQIVTTCHECRGRGDAGLVYEPSERES